MSSGNEAASRFDRYAAEIASLRARISIYISRISCAAALLGCEKTSTPS